MAIKYIFADVDGTLGIGGIGIPEKNRLAIRKYVEEGGSFGVCTGRSPDSVKGFIGDLPINMNITVRQSRQSGVARATCPD